MTEPAACPVPEPGAREARAARDTQLRELVARTAAGDQAAFALLYDALSPMLHGTCLRVLVDRALAAETLQEVMMEVWTRAADYAPERGSVHAWAATIAHRRAVDVVRSEVSRTARERTTVHLREVDDTDDALMREADAARVTGCLETLTALENEALLEAYYGGHSYAEVATRLAAPLATIKSRIRSALGRMRTCLEGI